MEKSISCKMGALWSLFDLGIEVRTFANLGLLGTISRVLKVEFFRMFRLAISILGASFAGGTSHMMAFYCVWVLGWLLVVCGVLLQFLLQ